MLLALAIYTPCTVLGKSDFVVMDAEACVGTLSQAFETVRNI